MLTPEEKEMMNGQTQSQPAPKQRPNKKNKRVEQVEQNSITVRTQQAGNALADLVVSEIGDAASTVTSLKHEKEAFIDDASDLMVNEIKTINTELLEVTVDKARAALAEQKQASKRFDFTSAFAFNFSGSLDAESGD